MTRTELAKSISFQLDLDFEHVLRGIDAAMDDEFGVEANEVPTEMAETIRNGFAEEAECR